MIIATAGHVDHGKTALIRALTGTDTDRLPEEKARGLSIDLGFAYQSLPNNKSLGFVDVPGHEKFIRNMLAGVGGIDLGLLVVAADDGIMPQTREHFAILNLLGIDQCVAAITRIDRVDNDRVMEVKGQVETMLAGAGYQNSKLFPLCAPANEGVETLKDDLLQRALQTTSRSADGHFRMAIDRVFTLKGTGLVVTGMVFSGAVGIDDRLLLSGNGSPVRVRAIHTHNEVSERAQAGQRCAINISGRGVSEASVNRGDWLMHPQLHAASRRIDVDLQLLDSESRPLKHWTPVHLHIAADHIAARVAVLSGGSIAPGESGLAQLVLADDAFTVHGDRFVLRDQSAQRTIGGGRVIDPCSPRRGRARASRITALRAMQQRKPAEVLVALTAVSEAGVPAQPFATTHNLTTPQMDAIIESNSLQRVGQAPAQWLFSSKQWQQLLNRIETMIDRFHQSKPGLPGAGLRSIQLALKPHLETAILEQATAWLVSDKRLVNRGMHFHLPSHVIQVSSQDRQLRARAAASLSPDSGSPPGLNQLAESLRVDKQVLEKSLKNAVKMGEMVMISRNRYLPTGYLAKLGYAAEAIADQNDARSFTVAEYCAATETGRNFAIELLEYFDRLGFTGRTGNSRQVKRPALAVFATDDD